MTGKSKWLVAIVGISLSVVAGLAGLYWSPTVAIGVFVGAIWNFLNLICLTQGLTVWFDLNDNRLDYRPRSRWYKIGLFVVKFPLLYGSAIWLLMNPQVSKVGFGSGFTVMIVAAMIGSGFYFQSLTRKAAPHGR